MNRIFISREEVPLKLKRYEGNPILKPRPENKWESKAVFNCGVTFENNLVHLLYRAIGEYETYISRMGYAISKDGINFRRFDQPVFEPQEDYESLGCEDPRITRLGGQFYITYTALFNRAWSGTGNRVALASTRIFKDFNRYGVILPDIENKDAVIFPEKIQGKYVMFHRIFPDIWIAYSHNLVDWCGHRIIMRPRKNSWDCYKIGAGAPPIKTECGWLEFYHGVDENKLYRLGVALFDLHDPSKLLARQDKPILEPEEDYEVEGDIPNVVFTCGAIEKDDSYYVYYGCADTVIGLATVSKEEALDFS